MKKLLFTFAILLALSGTVAAQETYSISLAALNVTYLNLGRVQYNSNICTARGLPVDCTQAQACLAYGVTGGASCTAADALAAGCRIFADTQAGREGFIKEMLIKSKNDDFIAEQRRRDRKAFYLWCQTANQTAKDAACVAVGQSAGCYICNGY
jgi:hypothetical protein